MTDPQPVDVKHLAQLREVMEGEYVDLLQTYIDNAPKELARVHNGIWSQDYDVIAAAAHTLKGSSSNIGASTLSLMFKELEYLARQKQPLDKIRELIERIQHEYQLVCGVLNHEIEQGKKTG